MKQHEWRTALITAVNHTDSSQLDAIAARLASAERIAVALQHHGYDVTGKPLDVVVCRALNMKAFHD